MSYAITHFAVGAASTAIIVAVVAPQLRYRGTVIVLGGTDWPVSPTVGPDPKAIAEDPTAFITEEVSLSGVIVDPEAGIVEVEYDGGLVATGTEGTFEVQLEGIPTDELVAGHDIAFGGALVDERIVDVTSHPYALRAPWERQYMFAVSFLGALLAVMYGLNAWRFDISELGFEPREKTLLSQVTHRGDLRG